MANYKTIYDVKELLDLQKKMNRKSDLRKIRRAYDFAEKAHENQKRLSGEKYIIHPLNVAYISRVSFDFSICFSLLINSIVLIL